MNLFTWAIGLFFVYLLINGQLVTFLQLATGKPSNDSSNGSATPVTQ